MIICSQNGEIGDIISEFSLLDCMLMYNIFGGYYVVEEFDSYEI
jgi:hypothetical protein